AGIANSPDAIFILPLTSSTTLSSPVSTSFCICSTSIFWPAWSYDMVILTHEPTLQSVQYLKSGLSLFSAGLSCARAQNVARTRVSCMVHLPKWNEQSNDGRRSMPQERYASNKN